MSTLIAPPQVAHGVVLLLFRSPSQPDDCLLVILPNAAAVEEPVKIAKAAGVLVSYDPNYRPSLWKSKEYAVKKMKSVIELVDVMKISDEESILLTGVKSYEQAADQLLAMGPKLVAVTLGEHGVLMATKNRKEIIKAFQTHAVDKIGRAHV